MTDATDLKPNLGRFGVWTAGPVTPEQARAVGRKALEIYLNLANYLNNWKRLGFTDDDVAKPGSDALVDAVAARLAEHLAAGADHVPVQVLTGTDQLVPALAELAGPLGLQ